MTDAELCATDLPLIFYSIRKLLRDQLDLPFLVVVPRTHKHRHPVLLLCRQPKVIHTHVKYDLRMGYGSRIREGKKL